MFASVIRTSTRERAHHIPTSVRLRSLSALFPVFIAPPGLFTTHIGGFILSTPGGDFPLPTPPLGRVTLSHERARSFLGFLPFARTTPRPSPGPAP